VAGRESVIAASILVLLVSTANAFAQGGAAEAQKELEKALKKEKIELRATVSGSVATLEGKVRNVFQKDQALEIALARPGIESVDSKIEVAEAESDQKLGEEVVKEIRRYSRFTVFDDASAYVEDGNVAIFGWVTEPYKKTEIEKRLHKVLGIRSFKNDIEVLPVSQSDERLRAALARNLYSDPMFSDFASMTIPPIHIIVSGSRVILTGVVSSQLMKQKAESIIRQTPGVLSLDSRLRLGS
jgi:osmotically-inducible protein OsmY